MPAMPQLPVPCPAHLIPDATGTAAFHTAHRQAMAHNAVFVATGRAHARGVLAGQSSSSSEATEPFGM